MFYSETFLVVLPNMQTMMMKCKNINTQQKFLERRGVFALQNKESWRRLHGLFDKRTTRLRAGEKGLLGGRGENEKDKDKEVDLSIAEEDKLLLPLPTQQVLRDLSSLLSPKPASGNQEEGSDEEASDDAFVPGPHHTFPPEEGDQEVLAPKSFPPSGSQHEDNDDSVVKGDSGQI